MSLSKVILVLIVVTLFVFQDAIDRCILPANLYASVFRGESFEDPVMTCDKWADRNLNF
jgi:hypothetical protein